MAGCPRIDHERLFEYSSTPYAVLNPDLTVLAANQAVEALLRDLGVDFAQGFGIHKPEPLRGKYATQN